MARINIEDKLFTDARFIALCNKVPRREAIGMIVDAWYLAQRYWLTDQKYIPDEEFKMAGLEPLVDCLFAKKMDNGYYIRGSEEQFDWLKVKQLAGKKSAEIRKNKFGSAQPQKGVKSRTDVEQCSANVELATEPLTLTLTHTLNTNTKYIRANKTCANKGEIADEKQTMADEIVTMWNKDLSGVLPKVMRLTTKRRTTLNAQIKKYPDLAHWQDTISKIKASDFLTGKSGVWKANFDWIMSENNRIKIIEGNYENKTKEKEKWEDKVVKWL